MNLNEIYLWQYFFISKRHCKAHQSLSFGFFSFGIFSITFFIYQNVFTVKGWCNFVQIPQGAVQRRRHNAPHFTLKNCPSLSDLYGCAYGFFNMLWLSAVGISRYWTDFEKKTIFDKFLNFRHILVSLHEFSEVNFFSFVSELIFFHSMNRYCYQIIRQ